MGQHCTGAAFPATVRAMSDEPAAQAHALLERLFALLHDCRARPPARDGAMLGPIRMACTLMSKL